MKKLNVLLFAVKLAFVVAVTRIFKGPAPAVNVARRMQFGFIRQMVRQTLASKESAHNAKNLRRITLRGFLGFANFNRYVRGVHNVKSYNKTLVRTATTARFEPKGVHPFRYSRSAGKGTRVAKHRNVFANCHKAAKRATVVLHRHNTVQDCAYFFSEQMVKIAGFFRLSTVQMSYATN